MESYEKIFLRNLLNNKDNLSEYVSGLYKGEGTEYSSIESYFKRKKYTRFRIKIIRQRRIAYFNWANR